MIEKMTESRQQSNDFDAMAGIEVERVDRPKRPPLICARATVPASLEHCWATLTDFAAYPEWMPRVAKCWIDRRPVPAGEPLSGAVPLRAVIALPGPLTDLRVDSQVSYQIGAEQRVMRWREDGGDLARNRGELRLERVDGGHTRVSYSVDIAPARSLPLFIWSRAVGWALPAVLRAFRRRLEQGALRSCRSAYSLG